MRILGPLYESNIIRLDHVINVMTLNMYIGHQIVHNRHEKNVHAHCGPKSTSKSERLASVRAHLQLFPRTALLNHVKSQHYRTDALRLNDI